MVIARLIIKVNFEIKGCYVVILKTEKNKVIQIFYKKDEERRKLNLFDTSPVRYDIYSSAAEKVRKGNIGERCFRRIKKNRRDSEFRIRKY